MTSRLLLGLGTAVLAVACAQSDAGITTSVKSQLVADEMVRARNIDVDTRDRIVTLRGRSEAPRKKQRRSRSHAIPTVSPT
jgi:osmotically-inducible protein OsmY